MSEHSSLRTKLTALAAVPIGFLLVVALLAGTVVDQPAVTLVAATGAVATLVVAMLAGFELAGRAAALARTADELATERLPQIVAQLLEPDAGPGSRSGADPESPAGADELDEVARAVARIETSARALVAGQRAAVSARLGEILTMVTRRSQSLLDRQIDHIDWLEATEQNPDRLEQLFKLDHLATRMRRISESVLVVAGGESTRARGGPAPMTDVLRVAMGETERYRHISLRAVEEAMIAGGPAFDLAHLLSELLENATEFSPPDAPVELRATRLRDGRYQVTVTDRGVGMDERQLQSANRLLADPGAVDLSLGRSVGFAVAGRLARRLGAIVEVGPTPGTGVTAQVILPVSALVTGSAGAAAGPRQVAAEPAGEEASPVRVVPPHQPGGQRPGGQRPGGERPGGERPGGVLSQLMGGDGGGPVLPEAPAWDAPTIGAEDRSPIEARRGKRESRTLDEALPTGGAFTSGVESLLSATSGTPAGEDPSGDADDSAAREPESPWEPPEPEVAAPSGGGLARREKGAAEIPTSAGRRTRASTRKPDEARSMITRYRDGLRGKTARGRTARGEPARGEPARGEPAADAIETGEADRSEEESP